MRRTRVLLCALALGAVVGCGGGKKTPGQGELDGGNVDGLDGGAAGSDANADDGGGSAVEPYVVSAPSPVLTLTGLPYPTVTFSVTKAGVAVPGFAYSVDRPDLGTIDANGVFTPSGAAGEVQITAYSAKGSATTKLTIQVSLTMDGDPDRASMPAGAGGVGGVGGEGGGAPISDSNVRSVLDSTAEEDAQLSWLYPYDGTVWPRGLPAPLLSWRSAAHPAVAVRIHIEVDDHFKFDGYFGPPENLPAGRPLTRLPIPQKVWRAALLSGRTMRVSLVAAARDGSGTLKAYKPASALTWTIAPGSLKGTVYYNSYGTKLAENANGAVGGNGRFGGATLAVRGDSYDPLLIAGSTTSNGSGCRVCHTVSGDGSLLMAQREQNLETSAYNLLNMNAETPRSAADNGKFGWAALSPDGKLALGNSGPPGSNGENVASLGRSFLYDVASGSTLNSPGFSDLVTRAAMPAFSPDGSKVAFNFFAGPGNADLSGNGKSLVVMDVTKTNDATYTFSNPKAVYTSKDNTAPGWPSFLPDGSGLVFQRELVQGPDGERFVTRFGARGDLWWVDLDGNAVALDRANGSMGLPTGPEHSQDHQLSYEPAVGPIVAGGYAWVVFTSRRMYGDVATRPPFESDPRLHDLTPASSEGPTTKKLWVFAIDMPPTPGKDPSHPAFYLPAQELYAGNSRGFWVPDACKQQGVGCTSGDECCGGYCRNNELGQPVCADELPPAVCANEYESCEQDSDCCQTASPLFCLGGRCAQKSVLE